MSIKISELPSATSVNDNDILPIVQDGTTKKATKSLLQPTIATAINSSSTNDNPVGAKAVYDYSAPIKHDSEGTNYGQGTETKYGHCKTINNLTSASYTAGEALAAYQGKVLDGKKEDVSNKTHVIDENSTDEQYPDARIVYNKFVEQDEKTSKEIAQLQAENEALLDQIPQATVQGESIHVEDSSNLPIQDFKLRGVGTKTIHENYTEIDYIESTGTQYIDTGIQTSNTIKVEAELMNTFNLWSGGNRYGGGAFGAKKSDTSSRFSYSTGATNDYLGVGSTGLTITKNGNYDLLDIAFDASSVNIDCGNYSYSNSELSVNITEPLDIYLFVVNTGGTLSGMGTYKLYKFKIYDNDVLVRDFVPALDNNNVVCLYDKVSETFFYNQGTGNFISSIVTGDNTLTVTNKNLALNDNPTTPDANYYSSGGGTQAVKYSSTEIGYYTTGTRNRQFKILRSGTYAFSIKIKKTGTPSGNRLVIYRGPGGSTVIGSITASQLTTEYQTITKTFTATAGDIIRCTFYSSIYWNNIQLELGNETTYEPHAEQTQLISLGDTQLTSIDTIQKVNGTWCINTTPITDTTLLGQLNNIPERMTTYKNVTNGLIEPTENNAQGEIILTYKKDLETIISNLNNAILSLGNNT